MTQGMESRTSAATAARMRASEEKLAAKLRERGWSVDPPEGKQFPTSLRHFMDYCQPCRDGGMQTSDTLCVPRGREPKKDGARYLYRCPLGHVWTCYMSTKQGYYSDCPCDYCWSRRDAAGDEHWVPLVPYNTVKGRVK